MDVCGDIWARRFDNSTHKIVDESGIGSHVGQWVVVYFTTRIRVVRLSINISSGFEAFKFANKKAWGVLAMCVSISSMSFSEWCPASSSTIAFRSFTFGAGQMNIADRLTRIMFANALYFCVETNKFPP